MKKKGPNNRKANMNHNDARANGPGEKSGAALRFVYVNYSVQALGRQRRYPLGNTNTVSMHRLLKNKLST